MASDTALAKAGRVTQGQISFASAPRRVLCGYQVDWSAWRSSPANASARAAHPARVQRSKGLVKRATHGWLIGAWLRAPFHAATDPIRSGTGLIGLPKILSPGFRWRMPRRT